MRFAPDVTGASATAVSRVEAVSVAGKSERLAGATKPVTQAGRRTVGDKRRTVDVSVSHP